jgi:hypothetical protein
MLDDADKLEPPTGRRMDGAARPGFVAKSGFAAKY